ncbi:MAG: response regulator [Sphaerochaetaceae bacterium]|nr:response regulator [Sphaerochaetaceae bacterium]
MDTFKGELNNVGLASFNQKLFDNMACFSDVVWVIDVKNESVEILFDNIAPDTVGMTFTLEEIRERIKKRYPGENRAILSRYTVEYLSTLKDTTYFNNPTFVSCGRRFKLRQAMTPDVDVNGETTRVYVTSINTQNFISTKKEKTEIYKTVSMILSHSRNHSQGINDTLNYLGNTLNVSRVFIIENDPDKVGYGSNTFEWCAQGVPAQIDKMQHISYAEYGFDYIFSEAQLYCCADIAEIKDAYMQDLFKSQGIKAFVNYAFYDNDKFAGLIGIDDCNISRNDWDPESEEIEILTFVADLLTTYLIKERNLTHALLSEAQQKTLRLKDKENKSLLNYFLSTYTSAYNVNLKARSFVILHMAHEFQQVFTMNGNMEDMARFVEEHVHPDDKEMMRHMTNPDYIRERLQIESKITFTVREQYNGQERVMHAIILRGLDSDHSAIGFMDVTQELKKEKETNEKLEAANRQAKIIETLSTTFSSVYYVDVATLKYRRIKEEEFSALTFPSEGPFVTNFKKYIEIFVTPEQQVKFDFMLEREGIVAAFTEKNQISIEYQRADNTWRRAFFVAGDFDENGSVKSFLFAVQNIAEEKQKQLDMYKALQDAYVAANLASEAKTTFLSNMSHDIRTPMNAIIGMSAIAGTHLNDPDKVANCLKKINSSSRHLLGLINQVLDMSKIESGKVDLNEENFILSDLIDEVISMNHAAGKARKHELSIKLDNLVHEKVVGDCTRLEQVINNLLSNAIKYTPDGGKIEIVVSEKETNKQNIGWYEIVIKDNGIGMSKDFVKTIFEPFSRANDERTSSVQGTGLGMPIARNIVRMMNGDIKVESELNKGSTFTVSFSLKLQSNQDVNYESFMDLPVLVVDDDVDTCVNACEILNSLSMNSEYVTSGQEAVDKTVERHKKQDDYFAIIMDWKMPGMDGIEATRQIRTKVGSDVPIIVLTSYDWSDIEEEAKKAGVDAFLSKPLFKSKIIEVFNGFTTNRSQFNVQESKQEEDYDFTGKRVLLNEDNEINQEIAVELLSATGVEIDVAENGSIGVDKFTSKPKGYYDLIFMDIQMPVMNGYDAARAIRASGHPDATKIPIIAMTANAFSTDVRAAFEAGMNGHISKPIDMDVVLKTMKKHLSKG